MNRLAVVVAIAALAAPVVSPQAQQKTNDAPNHVKQQRPSAFILGRVVDAATNQPIVNATVALGGREGGRGQAPSSNILTSDTGYFLFRDLAGGNYSLIATAFGYLPGGYGQRRPGGPTQPISIADAERSGNVTIRLWKEATLSGRITDESGDPISGLAVSLLGRDQLNGAPAFRVAISEPLRMAYTDALGQYRFAGVLPGEFVVSVPNRLTQVPVAFANADPAAAEAMRASGFTGMSYAGLRGLGPTVRVGDVLVQTSAEGSSGGSNALASQLPMMIRSDGAVSGYAATFFPGTSVPSQATAITLASGEDRPSVDLRLRSAVLGRVGGRLVGPAGPVSGVAVHLIPAFAIDSGLERTHETGVTVTAADGAFTFVAVPPGEYVIKAWRLPQSLVIGNDALPSEPTLWARASGVAVSPAAITKNERNTAGLEVTLRPGSAIRGRVVMEGTTTPLAAARFQTALSVAFEPAWSLAFGARLSVRVSPALEFVTQGLPPGRYAPVLPNQFVPAAVGWYFEAATRAGQDLMISPITLEPGVDATDVVLTFADRRTTLSGSVVETSGRPHPNAAVVVFPANYRTWVENGMPPLASFATVVSQSGVFSFDVRPGDYFVAAIDEARIENWRREGTITALAAQATRMTITRGDNTARDLRVAVIRTP